MERSIHNISQHLNIVILPHIDALLFQASTDTCALAHDKTKVNANQMKYTESL